MEKALETVIRLLDELGCKYELHGFGDAAYSQLGEGELSLMVINPNADRNMDIDFQSEISLFFAEWHDHFPLDKTEELCAVITGIVKNEICSRAHFLHGSEQQWVGSGLSCKDKSRLSDFQYIPTIDDEIAEYTKAWAKEEEIIEVHFLFWDTKDDRVVIFGRHNSVLEMKYGLVDEIIDILNDVDDLLEELGCEYDIHRDSDEEFPDYTENDACVIVFNPYVDRNMMIEITKSEEWSEITLYFAEQHAHYAFDNLPGLLDDIRAIITNELGDGEVCLGKERRPSMGGYVLRADVENKPPVECFGVQITDNEWEKLGVEVRFKFWNPKFDKTVVIEKKS